MKLFVEQPIAQSALECAAEMLDVVPLIMRTIRAEVRSRRGRELSVAQFRALAFLGRNKGAKLSDLANFLGLTAPSASKLVDGLVAHRLVIRTVPSADRRRVSLALSAAGVAKYESIVAQAMDYLAGKVAHLGAPARARLLLAMRDLRACFESDQPSEVADEPAKAAGTEAIKPVRKGVSTGRAHV